MTHSFFDPASYDPSLYSLPVASVAAGSLLLGATTFIREKRSSAAGIFLGLQALVFVWLFGFAVVYSTAEEPVAATWLRIMALGLVFIPAGVLAFAAVVTEQVDKWRPFIVAALVISLGFAIAGNIENSFFTREVEERFWGFYPVAAPGTALYAVYQTICLLTASYILWSAHKQTVAPVKKRRLGALLIALNISYLSGLDFLPTSGVEVYPFGFVFIAAFVVLATRAIWRYRLVDLTPELAAPQIIDTMTEALLVVDPDGIVRVANSAAAGMFGAVDGEIVGRDLQDVTTARGFEVASVMDKNDVSQIEMNYGEGDARRTIMVSSCALTNEFGDVLGTIHIGHDITERKRAEETVARSESLYRALFETSPDAVILTDRSGVIVKANQGAARLFRAASPDELVGRPAAEFVSEPDRERVRERMASGIEHQILHADEYSLVAADGVVVPSELSLSRVQDADGQVDGFLAVARDISERKQAEQTIQHLAYHDALTGLANRSLLLQQLSEAMTAADETGSRVVILYLDLDGMKAVNDTFGHAAGDEVLRMAGSRLSSLVRREDVLARVGGDEFVVVMPDVEREEQIITVTERILGAIRQPFTLPEGECELSVSIGLAMYPGHAAGIETLLHAADAAMYEAKARGGNQFAFAGAAQNDIARAITVVTPPA